MDSPERPLNRKYPIKIIHLDESKLNYAKGFKPTNKICAGLNLPTKVDLREPNSYIPNSYIPNSYIPYTYIPYSYISNIFSIFSNFSNSNTSNNQTSNNQTPNKIMPPVYDQGELGSCTANALCAAMQFNNSNIQGSRLFLYFNERMIENTIDEDDGAYLSDGIQALIKYGVCQEEEWLYDITQFKVKPTDACYAHALAHRAIKVENIAQDLTRMKKALWSGYPIILAIEIYDSFRSEEVKKSGIVSMPNFDKEQKVGGHAILVVGYDDEFSIDNIKGCWICRNSHGTNWGDNGYFRIPYKYLLDKSLTTDLWIILEST